jgi:chorismate mutase
MQWMRERDQLIEQTRAFVEGIAAARPAGMAVAPVGQVVKPAEPPRPIELPAMSALAPCASERAEIEHRVAKFKAQQQKFQRQREADYHKIFSKTRPAEGNAAHS